MKFDPRFGYTFIKRTKVEMLNALQKKTFLNPIIYKNLIKFLFYPKLIRNEILTVII